MRTNEEYNQLEARLACAEKALAMAHKASADTVERLAVDIMLAIAGMDLPPKSDTAGAEYYRLKGRGDALELIQANYLPLPQASNDG